MLVRNAFEYDFLEVTNKSREWGDLVIEREGVYHILMAHFRKTCFIAEDRGKMIGYLLGFRSQVNPDQAFLHLIQVDPAMRGHGIGKRLFKQFQAEVKKMGCTEIHTIARPENKVGMGFHKGMGFEIVKPENSIDIQGVPAAKDYNGPGKHMVLFVKKI
ncbi:N-acetyltransferase [Methanocella sp. CWC-04]|uniref:N-acetyltransferase n=1 Tax=Methanooceanicella nereidis TaxID=2052831 RepID=A0AAP2W5W0_9EURY|nr:GNAT family N-acetyltransferase [Methanocella sp. CWC-04]MCD1294567.1 N-acetyltransferase [Methanocella sp. CWC-04]